MVFDQSVRGLAPGAAIDLLGVDIGRVRSVALQYDAQRQRFPVEVMAEIYPLRLGPVREALLRDAGGAGDAVVLQQLVANGLRAQLRTGNLLTGQLYVALDFIPGPPRTAAIGERRRRCACRPRPGRSSELQPQIAEIVQKVSKIPFDDIGRDLRTTLSQRQRGDRPAHARGAEGARRGAADAAAARRRRSRTSTATSPTRTRRCSATSRTRCSSCSARRGRCASCPTTCNSIRKSLLRGKPADAPVPQPLRPPCAMRLRLHPDFVARRVRCGEPASASAVLALAALRHAAADRASTA